MGAYDGHRERLRKRFRTEGMEAMVDEEVLELLLFYALPRRDTRPLAADLLKHFGSIAAVLEAPPWELKQVGGIGENAAVLLHLITPLARRYLLSRSEKGKILLTTGECSEFLYPYFFGATEEMVYILCLDAKCKVIACRRLQEGGVNSVSFSVRRVVEIALSCGASSVVLAHNHTSGIAEPSQTDVETTLEIQNALETLGIVLADHIVISDSKYVSILHRDEEKEKERGQ